METKCTQIKQIFNTIYTYTDINYILNVSVNMLQTVEYFILLFNAEE